MHACMNCDMHIVRREVGLLLIGLTFTSFISQKQVKSAQIGKTCRLNFIRKNCTGPTIASIQHTVNQAICNALYTLLNSIHYCAHTFSYCLCLTGITD